MTDRLPKLPRLKKIVVPIPISDHRVALRRGSDNQDFLVRDLPGSPARLLLGLMDGTRDQTALASAMRAEGHDVGVEDVARFVADLHARNLLDDGITDAVAVLAEDQLLRYSRNLSCWSATVHDGRTPETVQSDLAARHVLVVGVGGLGSAVAQSLTMAGVGKLTLADFDDVELQNLNRQCLYETADVGKPKTFAAKERLRRINPGTTVEARQCRVTGLEFAEELVQQVRPDAVVGGADRPTIAIDRWLTDACFTAGIPYMTGGVSAAKGWVWTKTPGHGCFDCDQKWLARFAPVQYEIARYREERDVIPATSALSFGAQIVAGMVGYDVMHHLLGAPLAAAGRLIGFDFHTFEMTSAARPIHQDCGRCR